jgi:serine/threonine-protein kinase
MGFERGALFDRYRIEALIGEGGMGRVYRAHDTRLHRVVALKILRGADSPEAVARMIREARAAAALNHPNAISIYDIGEAATGDGSLAHYIAMELIEGRDLRSLAREPTVTQALRLRWLADVARALAAAHATGLVHRDVKPENVMVRADGVVKVLDFGLARRVFMAAPDAAEDAHVPTVTAKGVVVGTPLYMSPEQLRGDAIDGRADQFSWAVMAYELLAGAVPWKCRDEPIPLIAEILATSPPPLAEKAPEVPAAIAAAVMRAMSKSPDDRFPTMDALLAVLEQDGQPAPSIPRSLSLTPDAGPLAFAPTIVSTRTSMAAADAARSMRPPRRRSNRALLGGVAVALLATGAYVASRARGHDAAVANAIPAAPSATAVTDLPVPADARPEASAEYRMALERMRVGDMHGAPVHMRRAVAADPDFAPALLFLGVHVVGNNPSEGREFFRRAEEHANRLTERDRAWLEAFKAFVQEEPPNLAETRARMEKAVARFPRDAWLRAELADILTYMGDFAAVNEHLERALEIDPKFAYALSLLAANQATLGDFEAAERSTDRCMALAPITPLCVEVRANIDRQRGSCAQLEQRMRKAIAIDPSSPNWYLDLAEAMFAQGKPPEAVREAAQQGIERATDAIRLGTTQGLYPVAVDVLAGDFDAADAALRAREAQPEIARSADEPVHAVSASMRVAIALETGRAESAAEIARAFLARREAWSPDPTRDDIAMSKDIRPELLHAELRAGRLPAPEYEALRGAWTDQWSADAPLLRGYVWMKAYGAVADSPAAGAEALNALPRFEPLPKFAPEWATDARLGGALLFAGRPADAVPALRRAGAACTALSLPFEHVRALAALGDALDATGDRAGACEAYGRVLARWGSAKPRSITADRVRARARALACRDGGGG